MQNITRDRNRPSIVPWSVPNETPISDARNDFLKALVERVRELDDTRLVTAALERGEPEGDTQVIGRVEPPGRPLRPWPAQEGVLRAAGVVPEARGGTVMRRPGGRIATAPRRCRSPWRTVPGTAGARELAPCPRFGL